MVTRVDNRWKAIIGMSSDHAGINQQLGRLRSELYRVLASVEEPRKVRDYLEVLVLRSRAWSEAFGVPDPRK